MDTGKYAHYKFMVLLTCLLNQILLFHRFARIVQLQAVGKHCEAHIQWLEHSSLHLQEAHHPSELFLLPICDRIDARHFKMKLAVAELEARSNVPEFSAATPADEFFVRYVLYACTAPFDILFT